MGTQLTTLAGWVIHVTIIIRNYLQLASDDCGKVIQLKHIHTLTHSQIPSTFSRSASTSLSTQVQVENESSNFHLSVRTNSSGELKFEISLNREPQSRTCHREFSSTQ